MAGFDLITSTVRAGVAIDEVEFEVADAPPVTAYMLGRTPERTQPVAVALHHERGDKATLLPDLEHLASRGFLCLSVDSPLMRQAAAARDQLAAFESQFAAALTAVNLLRGDPTISDRRIALIGRGLGGEVAASVATHTLDVQVVVAIHPLLRRDSFVGESTHPLAAGVRQFLSSNEVTKQVAGLAPRNLNAQLVAGADTHWLLQVADDDDRLSSADRETLAMSIPRTVRVDTHQNERDATTAGARRNRVDFVTNLCG